MGIRKSPNELICVKHLEKYLTHGICSIKVIFYYFNLKLANDTQNQMLLNLKNTKVDVMIQNFFNLTFSSFMSKHFSLFIFLIFKLRVLPVKKKGEGAWVAQSVNRLTWFQLRS